MIYAFFYFFSYLSQNRYSIRLKLPISFCYNNVLLNIQYSVSYEHNLVQLWIIRYDLCIFWIFVQKEFLALRFFTKMFFHNQNVWPKSFLSNFSFGDDYLLLLFSLANWYMAHLSASFLYYLLNTSDNCPYPYLWGIKQ